MIWWFILTRRSCEGQTEWTKSGRYTGTTELDLTLEGRQQVLGTAQVLVGSGKLIDPTKLACVFVSPRKRAQTTFDLLFRDRLDRCIMKDIKITTTGELSEWDYGAYEGLVTREIHSRRQEQGLDLQAPWNIWKDGCEDGEYDPLTRLTELLLKTLLEAPTPLQSD